MTVSIDVLTISNAKVGLSAGHTGDLVIGKAHFNNVETGVFMRDPVGLLETLGLPADTPPELLMETFAILRGIKTLPPSEQARQLQTSGLAGYLNIGERFINIANSIVSMAGPFM